MYGRTLGDNMYAYQARAAGGEVLREVQVIYRDAIVEATRTNPAAGVRSAVDRLGKLVARTSTGASRAHPPRLQPNSLAWATSCAVSPAPIRLLLLAAACSCQLAPPGALPSFRLRRSLVFFSLPSPRPGLCLRT
jgi:hypothetical protein